MSRAEKLTQLGTGLRILTPRHLAAFLEAFGDPAPSTTPVMGAATRETPRTVGTEAIAIRLRLARRGDSTRLYVQER